MEMRQAMERLLAKMDANQEEIKSVQQKMDASQEQTITEMDAWLEEMRAR
jgi:uncharacterized protein (DUF305 family)